jgi:ribosome-associated protein
MLDTPIEMSPGRDEVIRVGEKIRIPETELRFTASRSSGPGGQNVNKVNTRVTLFFDINQTSALAEEEKLKVREFLATRVNKQGVLRVVCQRHRSQAKNRKGAIVRFAELLEDALREKAPRVKTRISASAKRRRLEEKTRRSRRTQDTSRCISQS